MKDCISAWPGNVNSLYLSWKSRDTVNKGMRRVFYGDGDIFRRDMGPEDERGSDESYEGVRFSKTKQ